MAKPPTGRNITCAKTVGVSSLGSVAKNGRRPLDPDSYSAENLQSGLAYRPLASSLFGQRACLGMRVRVFLFISPSHAMFFTIESWVMPAIIHNYQVGARTAAGHPPESLQLSDAEKFSLSGAFYRFLPSMRCKDFVART